MTETTTGYTPTDEDVETAAEVLRDWWYEDGYDESSHDYKPDARHFLGSIGPIIERERLAAQVEALKHGSQLVVCAADADILDAEANEIERGDR